MTTLIILLILALLITLFLRTRIGVSVQLRPEVTELRLRFGIFSFKILPAKPRKKPVRAKVKKAKKEKPKPPVKKKPLITPGGVIKLLPSAGRAVGRLFRGVTIHRLYFHIVVATDDVARTAELFGAVHAGLGIAAPLTTKVKNADITVGLDYTLTAPAVYLSAALSIRTGTVLAVGLSLLWAVWRQRHAYK